MVNLFDIARQARAGMGLEALSRQFGLNGRETERALDALLPAFSLAFQRHLQDPQSFARLLDAMTSGRYAPFFDGGAETRPGPGEDVLRTIFGSPDAAGQIARQGSGMTGIAVQVLERMIPVVGATLLAGLFRSASVEGFADLLRQWSDALRAAAPGARPPPRPTVGGDPWSAWFDMIPSAMVRPRPPEPTPPADPFSAWAAMMGAMLPAPLQASSAPARGTAAPSFSPPVANPFESLSRMFEAGREIQEQNLAALARIVDGGLGSSGRP